MEGIVRRKIEEYENEVGKDQKINNITRIAATLKGKVWIAKFVDVKQGDI